MRKSAQKEIGKAAENRQTGKVICLFCSGRIRLDGKRNKLGVLKAFRQACRTPQRGEKTKECTPCCYWRSGVTFIRPYQEAGKTRRPFEESTVSSIFRFRTASIPELTQWCVSTQHQPLLLNEASATASLGIWTAKVRRRSRAAALSDGHGPTGIKERLMPFIRTSIYRALRSGVCYHPVR